MSFAENLQTLRRKNGMTQEELAELLDVSRQAVSKWELGEGYPEVEKLLVLSKKLNVSLDSLMGDGECAEVSGESPDAADSSKGSSTDADRPVRTIRIVSPNEGSIVMSVSRVTRSQRFKGGKNSPKYALYATDGGDISFWGAQNTFLGWYRELEDITREIEELRTALDAGEESYTLQYSVKCRQDLFRTIEG